MKKLLKLLLASLLVFSLAACSSDDEEDDDTVEDVVEVDGDGDWRDELEGRLSYLTVNYDGEERDIIIQVASETQLCFYFDQEDEEMYETITLPFGTFEEDYVLNTLEYGDDEITFEFFDGSTALTAVCENGIAFDIDAIYANEANTPTEMINTWYWNADLAQEQFIMESNGVWVLTDDSGTQYNAGYSITDYTGTYLYDFNGSQIAEVSINDDVLDIFNYDEGEMYYWTYENSTYQ